MTAVGPVGHPVEGTDEFFTVVRSNGVSSPEDEEVETMARLRQRITPCLWFDGQAEEAARFYTGIFENSRITSISHFGKAGFEIHGRPEGSVAVVAFELDGHTFTALNGGPHFTFNEAISLQVNCSTQEEIDHYWEKLSVGGDPRAQQCGWLKDRFGLSWQVVPESMEDMFAEVTPASERAMEAMLRMKKIDIAELRRAHDGGGSPEGTRPEAAHR